MGMPADIGIIDTMVGFPSPDRSQVYKFIQPHLRDEESKSFSMPAAYMFKDVPPEIDPEAEAAARAEAEADPDFGDDPFAPDDLA